MIGSARFQRAVRGIPASSSLSLCQARCRTLHARCVRAGLRCDRDDEGITIDSLTRYIVMSLHRIDALTIQRFHGSTRRRQ
jgi:hypothetical protein